jgi:hypothetical protein
VLQFKLQAQLFCHVSILHEHDRAAFILVVRSSKALMPSNARVKKPWACHTNAVTHPVLFQTNTAQAKQERKKEKCHVCRIHMRPPLHRRPSTRLKASPNPGTMIEFAALLRLPAFFNVALPMIPAHL